MEGFTFYPPDKQAFPDSQDYEFKAQERRLFKDIKSNIQAGLGITGFFNSYRAHVDLIFVTVFRAGSFDDVASPAKGNQRRDKVLAKALFELGYAFVQVDGAYRRISEESYCVINYKEDTQEFVNNISYLAHKFGQDSVLVIPAGESAFIYNSDGSRDVFSNELPTIMRYVTKIYTSVKFLTFALSVVDTGWRDSLRPLRNGRGALFSAYYRNRLIKERS